MHRPKNRTAALLAAFGCALAYLPAGRALAAVCPARPWQRRPGCLDGGIQHGKAGPDARHAIWGGMRSVAVCY